MNRKALGLVLLTSAATFVAALAADGQKPATVQDAQTPAVKAQQDDEGRFMFQSTTVDGKTVIERVPYLDTSAPAGTLIIARPLENEVTTLEVIRADALSDKGTTLLFGRTEWYTKAGNQSSYATLIELGGAGVNPAAAFTRVDANTMLVSMDKSVLKITFAGTEKKMLTAVVEDVTQGKVVMVVSAIGNWEIADTSRFGRSLPALIAALSPQIGTACDPSYEQTRQAAKETCPAIIKTTYTCTPGNVSTSFNCGP
jgi:hypothetical protein